jgi:hypothetical protein
MDIKHIAHSHPMSPFPMKSVYVLQPYYVGSKHGKSLAIVIPAKVARKYNLDSSTIFSLKTDDLTHTITLQNVHGVDPLG